LRKIAGCYLVERGSCQTRALAPALPRIVVRDPAACWIGFDDFASEPRGAELLPPMARLLRTIGVPVSQSR